MANPNIVFPGGATDPNESGTAKPEIANTNDDGNSDDNKGQPLDPAAAVKPKRGRPPGSGNKARNSNIGSDAGNTAAGNEARKPVQKTQLAVGDLATQLEGLHKIVAVFLKNPTVEISADEARKLATALQNLSKQYSIVVSPVVMAWLQMAGVSAAVYGPRIAINIKLRKMAADEEKKKNSLQNAGQQTTRMGVPEAANSAGMSQQTGTMKFQ